MWCEEYFYGLVSQVRNVVCFKPKQRSCSAMIGCNLQEAGTVETSHGCAFRHIVVVFTNGGDIIKPHHFYSEMPACCERFKLCSVHVEHNISIAVCVQNMAVYTISRC